LEGDFPNNSISNMSTKMIIDHSGNVGIGTPGLPEVELHLAGSDNTPTLLIKPNTMEVDDVSQIQFADPDGGTGTMSIQYKDDGTPDLAIMGGNVGIGTPTPEHTLDVRGHIGLVDHLIFNSTSTDGVINWPESKNLWFRTNSIPGDINSYTTRMIITGNGNVGIGTTTNLTEKLNVNGKIRVKEEVIIEDVGDWGDYVLLPKYKLLTFYELEKYINDSLHLPGVKSASEIEKNGYNVLEINKQMMVKIEELTLYIIQLEKRISELEKNKNISHEK